MTRLLHEGIPVWLLLLCWFMFVVGRIWQWLSERASRDKVGDILSTFTARVALAMQPKADNSLLADALIDFRRSLAGVDSAMANKINPACIHGQDPDECPVCRH